MVGAKSARRSVRGRRWVASGLALALVGFAACSGAGSQGGKALRYGFDFESGFTNTFDVSKSAGDCDQIPGFYIYDSLIHWNAKTETLEPGQALTWKIDGRTVTLTLRQGLKFQDGEPFNSQAVKAGLEHNNLNKQLTSLDIIDSIDTPDPYTVVIHTKDDTGLDLFSAFTGRDGMIMAPKSFAHAGTNPVGAGPYKFSSYTPGSKIELKRWSGYWDKSAYKIPTLDFTNVSSGPPSVVALRAGSIDMVSVQTNDVTSLKKDKGIGVIAQPTNAFLELQFRTKDAQPWFKNVKVRQAIRYAINTDEINKTVQRGLGEVATQSEPKGTPAYNPDIANAYPHNPTRAKELLKEAGYPNGFTFTLVIPGGGLSNMEDQAAKIQDDLAAVGIKAKIKRIIANDLATNYYISGQGDAFAAAELASKAFRGVYRSEWGKNQFVAIWTGAERDDITANFNQAITETDDAKAAATVQQAAKIVSDEALNVPIAFMPQVIGYQKDRVGGQVGAPFDICDPPNLTKATLKG